LDRIAPRDIPTYVRCGKIKILRKDEKKMKNIKLTKLASSLMAGAMVFGAMVVPAFATTGTVDNTVTVSATSNTAATATTTISDVHKHSASCYGDNGSLTNCNYVQTTDGDFTLTGPLFNNTTAVEGGKLSTWTGNSSNQKVELYTFTTINNNNEAFNGNADKNPANYGVTYTVTIPQRIHLINSKGNTYGSSGTYTQAFEISAKGLIGENQQIAIVAEKSGTLTGTGFATGTKAYVVAKTSETTENGYTYANGLNGVEGSKYTVNYTATADLTPGSWQGWMDVSIALQEKGTELAS
jgi:hypothetical protein